MKEGYCACGLPLHYTDPAAEEMMMDICRNLGEEIPVLARGVEYLVQRHYIALHGLRAENLPELASQGLVRAVTDESREVSTDEKGDSG